jgi:polyhydroxybutyrate depolymerase
LSNKIAAIATIAASMPAVSNCTMPHYPISVLFMNGTDDNHMPYNGGYVSNPPNPDHGSVIATEAAIDYWVNYNQTDTQAITSVFSDIDTNDGGVVQKFSYKNGVQGTEVVLYKVNGGGHSAPSIREQYSAVFEQYFNKQNHDIEATVEIWNFFKDKTLF